MKYIFLDIDGVLNSRRTVDRCEDYIGIEDEKLALLKNIIDMTEARVVLVSTWKDEWEKEKRDKRKQSLLGDYLDAKMSDAGIEIYDKTPNRHEGVYLSRGEGILAFIDTSPAESFVIIDDNQYDYDGCGIIDRLVRTDFEGDALTPSCAEAAIKILNKRA